MSDIAAEQTAIRRVLLANGYTPLANGTTAPEATKRGYGLWRGEVIHPADPRMDEIVASDDPIMDTKGLGLRYVSVRGSKVVPHFRVHDPEKFSAALDRMFPAVHDAVVRLVAEDIRVGGYDALARWCVGTVLPERFKVADVVCEMRCREDAVSYRPDISVLHSEGGRIELEVVNTHAPEARRLDAAWGAGHLVLSLRIRDLVEEIVFSEGRGAVPEDDALRGMLRGRRFGLCGRERIPEAVQVAWRDVCLRAYAEKCYEDVGRAWRAFYRDRVEPVFTVTLWGAPMSALDDPEHRRWVHVLYHTLHQIPDRSGYIPFSATGDLVSGYLLTFKGFSYSDAYQAAFCFEDDFGEGRTDTDVGAVVAKIRRRLDAIDYLVDVYRYRLHKWVKDEIRARVAHQGVA